MGSCSGRVNCKGPFDSRAYLDVYEVDLLDDEELTFVAWRGGKR